MVVYDDGDGDGWWCKMKIMMINDDDDKDDIYAPKEIRRNKEGQKRRKQGEHLILAYEIVFVMLQKSFAGAWWLVKRKVVDLVEDINTSNFE